MKISQEVKVGLLAIVTLLMLFFGFNFLKGSDFFSSNHKYTVIYDNIDGLTASNPVQINGLTVGQIRNIRILQDQGNKLLVTVEVNSSMTVDLVAENLPLFLKAMQYPALVDTVRSQLISADMARVCV